MSVEKLFRIRKDTDSPMKGKKSCYWGSGSWSKRGKLYQLRELKQALSFHKDKFRNCVIEAYDVVNLQELTSEEVSKL